MLKDAAENLTIDLKASYFVGDTNRDVEAGLAAGVIPILLDADYNRDLEVTYRVADLEAAADLITRRISGSGGQYAPASGETSW
jgi:histidinol phosphatase-like enzyme